MFSQPDCGKMLESFFSRFFSFFFLDSLLSSARRMPDCSTILLFPLRRFDYVCVLSTILVFFGVLGTRKKVARKALRSLSFQSFASRAWKKPVEYGTKFPSTRRKKSRLKCFRGSWKAEARRFWWFTRTLQLLEIWKKLFDGRLRRMR